MRKKTDHVMLNKTRGDCGKLFAVSVFTIKALCALEIAVAG